MVTSQPVTEDLTLTCFSAHRLLVPKSDRRENNSHPLCTEHLHPFCVVSHSCTLSNLDYVCVFNHECSRFSWKSLFGQLAFDHRNTAEKPTVKNLFEVSQKIDSRTKVGNLRSVRNKLSNFPMRKAVPGEQRRNNQSLEGKSLCILRLCVVSWKSASVPAIKR